jgi:hypothetical protein
MADKIARSASQGYTLTLCWISGHSGVEGNERADEEAKSAAQGQSSDKRLLPKYLKNNELPYSTSATKQCFTATLKSDWKALWQTSRRFHKMNAIDNSFPSPNFLRLTKQIRRAQASTLIQLRTGHVGLNFHLHRIKKIDSPQCPHCDGITESIHHFLLTCPHYRNERHEMALALRRDANSMAFILNKKKGIKALLKFVNSTGRLKLNLGEVSTTTH